MIKILLGIIFVTLLISFGYLSGYYDGMEAAKRNMDQPEVEWMQLRVPVPCDYDNLSNFVKKTNISTENITNST